MSERMSDERLAEILRRAKIEDYNPWSFLILSLATELLAERKRADGLAVSIDKLWLRIRR